MNHLSHIPGFSIDLGSWRFAKRYPFWLLRLFGRIPNVRVCLPSFLHSRLLLKYGQEFLYHNEPNELSKVNIVGDPFPNIRVQSFDANTKLCIDIVFTDITANILINLPNHLSRRLKQMLHSGIFLNLVYVYRGIYQNEFEVETALKELIGIFCERPKGNEIHSKSIEVKIQQQHQHQNFHEDVCLD